MPLLVVIAVVIVIVSAILLRSTTDTPMLAGKLEPRAISPAVPPEALDTAALARESVATETPSERSDARLAGMVTLLRAGTRLPPPPERWIAEPVRVGMDTSALGAEASSAALDVASDEAGGITLPRGTWSIRPPRTAARAWVTDRKAYVVLPDQSTIAWLRAPMTVRVRVSTDQDEPIAGAQVRWMLPDGESIDDAVTQPLSTILTATTDGGGVVTLPSVLGPGGVLSVCASGFLSEQVPILEETDQLILVPLRRAAHGGLGLHVVDADTQTPISDAWVSNASGPIPGRSAVTGELLLPSWIEEGDELLVGAEQHCSVAIGGRWPPGGVVPLPRSAVLTVELSGDDGAARAGSVLLVPSATDANPTRAARLPLHSATDASGRAEITVPVDVPMRVLASGESGEAASADLNGLTRNSTVRLTLRMTGGLFLRLTSEGQPVSRAEATITLFERARVNLRGEAGLRIPFPGDVNQIVVSSPGRTGVILVRQGSDSDAGGVCSLELPPSLRAGIRLIDETTGDPVAGVQLRLQGRGGWKNLERHPELGGYRPTDHPCWIERSDEASTAVTDGSGLARFRIPGAGIYDVLFEPPRGMEALPVHGAFTSPSSQTVSILDETPQVLRIAVRRCLQVKGIDARTKRPVASLFVRAPEGEGPMDRERAGAAHSVWISERDTSLLVSSSGYAPARVDLGSTSSSGILVVLLEPTSSGRLEILTEGPLPVPLRLDLSAWVDASARSAGAASDWQGTVTLDPSADTELEIPLSSAFVRIAPLDLGAETVSFDPVEDTWRPAATIRFRLVRHPK